MSEAGMMKCSAQFVLSPTIDFIVVCDPVTELMTFQSTSSTVQKCGLWLRKCQFYGVRLDYLRVIWSIMTFCFFRFLGMSNKTCETELWRQAQSTWRHASSHLAGTALSPRMIIYFVLTVTESWMVNSCLAVPKMFIPILHISLEVWCLVIGRSNAIFRGAGIA